MRFLVISLLAPTIVLFSVIVLKNYNNVRLDATHLEIVSTLFCHFQCGSLLSRSIHIIKKMMMKFTLFPKQPPSQNPLKHTLTPEKPEKDSLFMKNHRFYQMKTNMIGFVNTGKPCGSCPKK